jgi:acyl carrier protein
MRTLDYVLAVVRSVAKERHQVTIEEDTDLLLHADLDSLVMLEVMEVLEEHYKLALFEDVDLMEIRTPRKIWEFVDRALEKKSA